MRSLRAYVPAAILLLGCALTFRTRLQAAVPLARPLSEVLANVDGYTVQDQVISDREQRIAGMSNYVARAYMRDTVIGFTTLVSYYDRQTKGKTIHSPRNCLPGAGWEVVSGGSHPLLVNGETRTVNRFVLRNGPASALAYYWYQGRGRVTANEYLVKWNLLRDAALAGRTEEALVRIVVPLPPQSTANGDDTRRLADADEMAKAMAARLVVAVDDVLPRLN
jgi:EpsI family protein